MPYKSSVPCEGSDVFAPSVWNVWCALSLVARVSGSRPTGTATETDVYSLRKT
jgi:hypothetical protein